ncbi:MAG: hypothetical protein GY847_13215, partial [Proteobacteria bacterium]|nr:hypothetical protein [Pseudomonadota bacterium]
LVEVKSSPGRLVPNLAYFQQVTGAQNAFQVEMDQPFIEENCFDLTGPTRIPAATLLSQLC